MYGGCGAGSRDRSFQWEGERCAALEGTRRNWYRLGEGNKKLHGFGGPARFHVYCFAYKVKGGTDLTVTVQSDEFQPEIFLIKKGRKGILAHEQGRRTAQFAVRLSEGGYYAVLVTSVAPMGTGRFDASYEAERART